MSSFFFMLIGLLVRLLLSLVFFATPLVGFWLASSLAAYLGGPPWMPWIAGALLFPVIPGLWELFASSRQRPESKAFLTPLDRLGLRTFAVGLVFLIVLLCVYPQTAFVSLSTRGDWMLDGVKDPRVGSARRVLFAAAGGLEWLYRATKNNPYKKYIDEQARQRADQAAQQREQDLAKQLVEQQEGKQPQLGIAKQLADQNATQEDAKELTRQLVEQEEIQPGKKIDAQQELSRKKDDSRQDGLESAIPDDAAATQPLPSNMKWPWKKATLHPLVASMPPSVETSIESVARYIAKNEKNPILRIKALHDYVADRIAYDSDSFFAGRYPPQDAQTVFATRKSVCAGYANLLAALAAAINEKIVVVLGDARNAYTGDKLTGSGHAWNAARIRGKWYLIDACWDAGGVSREKGFIKGYKTDYLLPPPSVIIQDHFPEDPTWQLLATPLSQGEFLRQPMLRPRFQAAELTLIAPTRVCNDADSKATAIVKNPENHWLMASVEQNGQQIGYSSPASNNTTAQLECPLPNKGTYRMNMFGNNQQYGDYDYLGSVDFVSR
jgi:hypothetical protein